MAGLTKDPIASIAVNDPNYFLATTYYLIKVEGFDLWPRCQQFVS